MRFLVENRLRMVLLRTRGQNRNLTWAHGRHQCRRHPGCALPAASMSVFRSCAGVELLPALYECRLFSLMVAHVVLRRSAAARERTLPGRFGERAFPGFPWMPTWLCGLVGLMSVWEAISGVVCAPAPTALSVASQWRSLAGHILRSEGKAGRRRGASRWQSACPPASFRTGHVVFTASGFPVSLQSSGVWSVLAFRKSADFGACGPQEEGLNACREGEGRSLTRIQVDRVDQA